MSETKTEPRVKCHCILTWSESGREARCDGFTSGPDDPFCELCTPRHAQDERVKTGAIKVSASLWEKEPAP